MMVSRSLDITYVPADCGSIIPGKSKAPRAFQDVGIVKRFREAGIASVKEHEALDSPATYKTVAFQPGSVRNEELNVLVCHRVRETISQNLHRGSSLARNDNDHAGKGSVNIGSDWTAFQLILGGECCMLPAIMSAFWHHAESQSPPQRVGLLYIDADTDLASPTDPSSTGNLAGMNMTHLVQSKGSLQSMKQFSRSSGEPVCDSSNTVLFGINMSNPTNKREHLSYLFDNQYQVISSASVAADPDFHAATALKYLEERVDTIMVHLDVDSIDPQMFPLANLPNFTGVGYNTMMRALRVILASDKVRGLTVAEVNPDHDPGLEMVDRLTGQIVDMLASRDEWMVEK